MAEISQDDFYVYTAISSTNGGFMGGISQELPTDSISALIPDITRAERLSGVTRHYKLFKKIANSANKILHDAILYLESPLSSEDYVVSIIKGNHHDVWADVESNRKYGIATLADNADAGESTLILDTKGASYNHFQENDKIIISDLENLDDITGKSETNSIVSVSWNGDQATLVLTSPLLHSYNTTRTLNNVDIDTRVSALIEYGDVIGSAISSNNTSVHGTTDDSSIIVNSVGSISQILTITFDSSSSYNVSSNVLGSLASGSKLTIYEPENSDFLVPYLSIPPSFWSNDGNGDWVAGDSVVIETTPCAIPHWIVIDIKPNSTASPLEAVKIVTGGTTGSS